MVSEDTKRHIERLKKLRPSPVETASKLLPDELAAKLTEESTRNKVYEDRVISPAVLGASTSSSLRPMSGSLSPKQARHLLRRATFSAKPSRVNNLVGRSISEVVDEMMNEASATPVLSTPDYVNDYPPEDQAAEQEFVERNEDYLYQLWANIQNGFIQGTIKDRLAFFWSNHFVTSYEEYFLATFGFRYWQLLHKHSLGNFKQFVVDVGLNEGMLLYLNGSENIVQAPNENYARELLELFTMGIQDKNGQDNYTEEDIVEIARALTGYYVAWYQMEVNFEPWFHDDGIKNILGQTGNIGYFDLHDIIFDQRKDQIAWHICSKIYKEFVSHEIDEGVVQEMSTLFLNSDFEIEPVVRALLKSEAFFNAQIMSSKIKSPLEYFTAFFGEMMDELEQQTSLLTVYLSNIVGQLLLSPTNVAGWKGQRDWITTSTLPNRWLLMEYYIRADNSDDGWIGFDPFLNLIKELYDTDQLDAPFRVPILLAEHLLPIDLESLDIPDVGYGFGGDINAFPIPDDIENGPEHIKTLCKIFLSGAPWYEFDFASTPAKLRMQFFYGYLMEIPEMQLV